MTQPQSQLSPTPQADAYTQAVADLRARMVLYAAGLWAATPALDQAGLALLVSRIVPAVQAAQVRVANLTSLYLAHTAGTDPLPVDTALVTGGRGIAPTRVYARPVIVARTALQRDKPLPVALDMGGTRLQSLVTTDIQMAKVRQADQSLIAAERTYYRRVPKGASTCALCLIAATQRYKVGNLLPIHPGCVPGESTVFVPSGGARKSGEFAWGEIQAVSRRLFQGELVEFVTARGDQVRVTPNHPVLTDQGWRPAHLLGMGDTVFRSGDGQREMGSGPQVNQRPALAKDVFDAARMAFPLVRMPLAAKDFHADRADGEVEIVYTDGHFPTPRGADVIEVVGEDLLVGAHSGRLPFDSGSALSSLTPGRATASRRAVGTLGLGSDLFGSHLGGPELSGHRPATRFDAPADEFSLESVATYSDRGLDLIGRLAGLVEADCIVELRRVGFSGHVFNLHTREGWYSSNSHIVSNCDCGVEELPPGADLNDLFDTDRVLAATHAKVKAFTAITDRGGRAPDYRKLLITHKHGELGDVLAWRGQHFTGPSDI